MNDSLFALKVEETLEFLENALEEWLDETGDVQREDGVLTVELEAGSVYIINAHRPTHQIWVSSPQSGGTHFKYDALENHWISTRPPSQELISLLKTELLQTRS